MTVPNSEDGKVFYLDARELAEGNEVVSRSYDVEILDQFIELEDKVGINLEAIWFRRVTRDALRFGWVDAQSLVGFTYEDTEFWREDRDAIYGWVEFKADNFVNDTSIRNYSIIPRLGDEDSDSLGLLPTEEVLVIYRS